MGKNYNCRKVTKTRKNNSRKERNLNAKKRSSEKGRRANALALGADEGRDKLR